MEIEKIDFHEAAVRLAKRAGIEMSFEDGVHAPSAHASFTMQLCEVYQRIAETFHHVLMHTAQGARARAYLASRKVTDDSIRTFKLGYAPPDPVWLFQFLRHKGYSPEFLARSGLFAKKKRAYRRFFRSDHVSDCRPLRSGYRIRSARLGDCTCKVFEHGRYATV